MPTCTFTQAQGALASPSRPSCAAIITTATDRKEFAAATGVALTTGGPHPRAHAPAFSIDAAVLLLQCAHEPASCYLQPRRRRLRWGWRCAATGAAHQPRPCVPSVWPLWLQHPQRGPSSLVASAHCTGGRMPTPSCRLPHQRTHSRPVDDARRCASAKPKRAYKPDTQTGVPARTGRS